MKKYVYGMILGFVVWYAYGQEHEVPLVMYELGSGYGIGINMAGTVPLEIKMIIPIGKFGFMLSGGADFAKDNGGHGVIGISYFIINNESMRIPLNFGLSISGNRRDFYVGFSGVVSYQYVLTKNIYLGCNILVSRKFLGSFVEKSNGTHGLNNMAERPQTL
jgi:hypothetical protein